MPIYTPFVEQKKNVDRSTLFSIKVPFQLLHDDIADIRFLAKLDVDLKCCLLYVELFTSKVYTYRMKKRSLVKKKMEIFYDNISKKRDMNETMRLQTDLEFRQNKKKRLNTKYNVDMFSTKVRDGKAFTAEQKNRELKKLLLKSKIIEKNNNRISPNKLKKQLIT